MPLKCSWYANWQQKARQVPWKIVTAWKASTRISLNTAAPPASWDLNRIYRGANGGTFDLRAKRLCTLSITTSSEDTSTGTTMCPLDRTQLNLESYSIFRRIRCISETAAHARRIRGTFCAGELTPWSWSLGFRRKLRHAGELLMGIFGILIQISLADGELRWCQWINVSSSSPPHLNL